MAINKQFEAYKVKRELKRSGVNYEFKRPKKNEFGEPSKELEVIGVLRGLYHEDNSHISVQTGDTTQYRTKKVPSILCLYEDAAPLMLQVGDTMVANDKTYLVTGVVNIQEWNIISDISLEVVDSAVNAKLEGELVEQQPEQNVDEAGGGSPDVYGHQSQ